ncbi:MAG: ATP-binding protein [Clostridia bacterium]|jgi:DNA replication protein DnaC|nr:ATP-binding protein [Clostridia bacterium]
MASGLKRQQKIAEWENRIQLLHQKYPRLEEISRLYGKYALELAFTQLGSAKMNLSSEEIIRAQETLLAERKNILNQYKLPPNMYEIWWDCEKCQDTGFAAPGIKCACGQKEQYILHKNNSGLSPEQDRQTFDSFSLDWYADKAKYREILQSCLDFADKVSNNQAAENLFLYGPVGTGKTHLCSAIAHYVLQAGKSVVYLKTSRLLDLIRQIKYTEHSAGPSADRLLQNLYQVDLLIIDDLGIENSTDFVKEQLLLLLDERINHHLPWVISTNLTPNEAATLYEDRLSDRVLSTSNTLKFEGESVRRQKKVLKNKAVQR